MADPGFLESPLRRCKGVGPQREQALRKIGVEVVEDLLLRLPFRYEDRTADFDEFAIGGYVNRCCMRYGLGYHLYDENEHTIMFSIGLSAFSEASISSGF